MDGLLYLKEEDVKRHLHWETLIPVIEKGLSDFSKKDKVIQSPRVITPVPPKQGVLLTMPCYSISDEALGCKIVTSYLKNKELGLPSIMANILLHNPNTGQLKAIIEGTHITGWRTAAASVVATKYLHKGQKKIMAILGAGTQAKSHALALQNEFGFEEVRIWNHNPEKAKLLVKELQNELVYKWLENNEQCVKNADIICTTTYAEEPILFYKWLKNGVHINAIGAGITHHSELDKETYCNSTIVTDSMASAEKELKGLLDMGVTVLGEIGEIINGSKNLPDAPCTVYHSLGIAIEDILAAELVYKSYLEGKESKQTDSYKNEIY